MHSFDIGPGKTRTSAAGILLCIPNLTVSDIGRLSPSNPRITSLPHSRLRLLPRQRPQPTPPWILVPCTNNRCIRFTTTCGDPWHRFNPIIDLLCHKTRDPSQRPPYICPRHRSHKHASTPSRSIPLTCTDHNADLQHSRSPHSQPVQRT